MRRFLGERWATQHLIIDLLKFSIRNLFTSAQSLFTVIFGEVLVSRDRRGCGHNNCSMCKIPNCRCQPSRLPVAVFCDESLPTFFALVFGIQPFGLFVSHAEIVRKLVLNTPRSIDQGYDSAETRTVSRVSRLPSIEPRR